MKLAPVVLFVYNRLNHTKKTLAALAKNYLAQESELIVFSDGPKKNSDTDKILEIRNYIKNLSGFKSIRLIERKENLGLSKSIIKGINEVFLDYERIIVLEDDIITSPYFLTYMNGSLDLYEGEESVISIHSYVYPVKEKLPETFFLLGADCQGWGTWKRGWDLFEEDGTKLLRELESKGLTKAFDFNGSYPYTRMLKAQIAGKTQSWAVRWYASAFLKNKYTLYPGKSYIFNTGFDASGTNCSVGDFFNGEMMSSAPSLVKIEIEEDKEAKKAFEKYFRRTQSPIFKIQTRIKGYTKQWFEMSR